MHHPNDAALLLRGSSKNNVILVDGLVIPPFPDTLLVDGTMLTVDSSIMGTAHSHPSGDGKPSLDDLHRFAGIIGVIAMFPYEGTDDLFVYDSEGQILEYSIED
ncbi:MAG: hypothetical protein QXU32_12860 [Nitrososphaerales archaeon]